MTITDKDLAEMREREQRAGNSKDGLHRLPCVRARLSRPRSQGRGRVRCRTI